MWGFYRRRPARDEITKWRRDEKSEHVNNDDVYYNAYVYIIKMYKQDQISAKQNK